MPGTVRLLAALAGLSAGAAAAEPYTAIPDNSPDAAERAALSGNAGWTLSGLATVDLLGNTRGGLRRGIRAPVKLSAAAAYDDGNGWTGVLSAQYVNGSALSGDLVGDTQTASNIEAISGLRVYEAWVRRDFGIAGIKFGLTDLNTDFDQQEAGALFLNSSSGIAAEFSHTGRNGPSIFPTTALAVTADVVPAPGWTLRAGVFDGVPGDPARPRRFSVHLGGKDGALLVAQATRRFDDRLRIAGGVWTYTAAFPALGEFDTAGQPGSKRTSRGAYGIVEGRLAGGGNRQRELTGWVRAGLADDRVNRIASYVGGGLTLAEPFGGRDGDDAGLAVMHAGFGGPARRAEPGLRGAETTIEATYYAALGNGFALQPDLQYVIHPNGAPGIRDALVVGIRLTFAVSH